MARFILDVANLDSKGIANVLDVIERDSFLLKNVDSLNSSTALMEPTFFILSNRLILFPL